MKIFDLVSMCVRNLARRKFRTFLTVTGVVIGTTSIVVMISLGIGISVSQDEMFRSFGDLSIINIYSWGSSSESTLDDATVEQIQAIDGVVIATPFMEYRPKNSYMQLYAGRKNRYENGYTVIGVKPEALEDLGYIIDEGVFLGQGEDDRKIQLICGELFPYFFYDTKKRWPNNSIEYWVPEGEERPDPFFHPLEQESYQFVVYPSKEGAKELTFDAQMVGVIHGEEYEWDKKQSCFMDVEDMKRIQKAYEKENGIKKSADEVEQYENVKVKVEDVGRVSEVQTQIEAMGFQCESMQQYRDQLQESTQQTQLILAILGGVSLFVSAISITNTMIMSVYERTREIGVMKVLGCLVGNIRAVFLMEAGLIGFLGGVVGIGFSFVLSFLLNRFGGNLGGLLNLGMAEEGATVSIIPLWLVLLGLAFATLVGLVSGFYPANRAVGISALEAIKQE